MENRVRMGRLWVRLIIGFLCICVYNFTSVLGQEGTKENESVTEKVVETSSGNISIDFKDADIRNVLRVLSLKSGVNIVAGNEVEGKVTIRLVDVPWEKALDVVLRTYGFVYERDENIIRVTTVENLKKEQLITKTFILNYANATEVKESISKMLTERGHIDLDERTNMLLVTEIPANINKIEKVIEKLDRMTAQVMIEAEMIETTLADDEKLGIDWTLYVSASGASRYITAPFDRGKGGTRFFPKEFLPYNDTSATGDTTSFPKVSSDTFTFGTLDFTQFQTVLEILKSRTDTKILSNPRIATMDNQEAEIVVGTIVPIPIYERNSETGTMEVTGYDEQQIGVKLKVTPSINQQNYITMQLQPEVSSIVGWTGPNNERPIISTREATTQIMVKDGQTIAIGGLIKEESIDYYKKVPVLGDIPLLGFFFRKKTKDIDTTDLLIFITPRIIRPEPAHSEPPVSVSEAFVAEEKTAPDSQPETISDSNPNHQH